MGANFFFMYINIVMTCSVKINRILDSKLTGVVVFGVTGLAKLASDYKNAPETNKDFVLLRDSLILGGTAVGVGAYGLASSKIAHSKAIKSACSGLAAKITRPIKNTSLFKKIYPKLQKINKPFNEAEKTAKRVFSYCFSNAMMLASGILGAIGADYGIQYSHIEKNKRLRKLSHRGGDKIGSLYTYENRLKDNFMNSRFNKDLENTVGAEVKSNIYSRVTDLPAMRMFSTTMVGMQGFEVIEEKTFKKRMKHATGCLISNSVIPLFFLSLASNLTRNMKGIVRMPIIFASLVGGTMYAQKAINKLDQRIPRSEKKKRQEVLIAKEDAKNTANT